jgi:hypothetical protein
MRVRHRVLGAAGIANIGILFATSSVAFADAITNGNFESTAGEGDTPNSWTPTNFGAETAPYSANISTYDVNGAYPPPAGMPGGNVAGNYAVEDFYEAGSNTGVEGFGGSQTLSSPVSSSSDSQLSWSTVETGAPDPSLANWAGSAVELDFTHGASTYELVFINPFTPTSGETASVYADSPTSSDTATTKYVVLATLTDATWYSQAPVDVPAAISTQFGFSTFTINTVDFENLEDTTNSGSPYPNMDSYWKNISLVSVPEPTLFGLLTVAAVGFLARRPKPLRIR